MERQLHGTRELAEKYLDDALHASSAVEYRDARIEPRVVIIKTRQVAPDLSGLRAWRFTIGKRDVISEKAEPIVWSIPSSIEFLYWAKEQTPETLRAHLGGQGIRATGSSRYVLTALLTYRYEEVQLKASGNWPLPEAAMDIRLRRIAAIEEYKDLKGGMTDEEIMGEVILRLPGYSTSSHQPEKELSMTGEKSADSKESPSEIRRRLRKEAEAGEAGEGVEVSTEGAEDAAEERGSGKTTPDSEMAAVRGGKKKKQQKTEESPSSKKGRSAHPTSKTTKAKEKSGAKAEPVEGEETEEMVKKGKGKKATVKKGAVKGAAKAAARPRTKYEGNIEKEFPVGSKIKYVGTRVAKHTGKVGEVTGHKNADGMNITFSDGSKGTATVGAVEIIKKGAGKK